MSKVVLIGAGSMKFTATLVNDILSTPALQKAHFALVDIDPDRLELARKLVQALIDHHGIVAQVETTTDRRIALAGADYVIITILVGGIEAYKFDIEIPMKYGVGQCVGDTLGPGGIFRGLRTIPALLDICHDMAELCPDALLLNYSNPMAILGMAIAKGSNIRHVGLCHSVQGTAEMLAKWIGAPYDEVSYWVAGINHQAWFLEFRWNGKDAYPLLRERIQGPEIIGQEPVRTDLMKYFGYFVTESSGHASEYLPYFRKNGAQIAELVKRFVSPDDVWFDWGRTGGCLRYDQKRLDEFTDTIRSQTDLSELIPAGRSHEYCSYIIEAIEINRPVMINGNVPNHNLITNLPGGCCVEVPCLVNGIGIILPGKEVFKMSHFQKMMTVLGALICLLLGGTLVALLKPASPSLAMVRTTAPLEADPAFAEVERSGTISVSGASAIKVQPDQATIHVGVETFAASPGGSKEKNSRIIKAVMAAVKANGVDEKDIQTDHYLIYPKFRDWDTHDISGYDTYNSVIIIVREVERFEDILVGALEAGATRVLGVEFSTSRLLELRNQARDLAVKAAREKAERLAEAAGLEIAEVTNIDEDISAYYSYRGWSYWWGSYGGMGQYQNVVQEASGFDADLGDDSSISLGQIMVKAKVQMTLATR